MTFSQRPFLICATRTCPSARWLVGDRAIGWLPKKSREVCSRSSAAETVCGVGCGPAACGAPDAALRVRQAVRRTCHQQLGAVEAQAVAAGQHGALQHNLLVSADRAQLILLLPANPARPRAELVGRGDRQSGPHVWVPQPFCCGCPCSRACLGRPRCRPCCGAQGACVRPLHDPEVPQPAHPLPEVGLRQDAVVGELLGQQAHPPHPPPPGLSTSTRTWGGRGGT